MKNIWSLLMIGLVIWLNIRNYNLHQQNEFLLNVARKSTSVNRDYLSCTNMSLDIINNSKIKVSQHYKNKIGKTLRKHQNLLNYIKNKK